MQQKEKVTPKSHVKCAASHVVVVQHHYNNFYIHKANMADRTITVLGHVVRDAIELLLQFL